MEAKEEMGIKEFFQEEVEEETHSSKKREKVSTWLVAIIWIFIVFSFLFAFAFSDVTFLGINTIWVVVGLFCGYKCSKWANEMNRSINWAFIIGFFLGWIGLLSYWFDYSKSKETKEDKERKKKEEEKEAKRKAKVRQKKMKRWV